MREIPLKEFRITFVEDKEQADLVLSTRQDETDFLSLGVYCLHLIVDEVECEEIKIFKEDFSKKKTGIIAFVNDEPYELTANALMETIVKYTTNIASYIIGLKNDFTILLGTFIYSQVTTYYMGVSKPLFLEESLPKQFEMDNTINAEEVAENLIKKYLCMN